ncbi:MAG: phosphoenolpyruvate synthase [Candidatus Levybacteria bacterium RIFCSPHIGHO2_02_FULL_42_12]|nr:MAG: phosphoenolpyruvate synthase [Candidatus Levybacteria bacterium RIFCSPHIGHO2_01_FULL_42_15]OGH30795.1 MAG: phosphoenolpyruvate synthase [Candidatus Levybacteria bacterium RIFCSPHIGHO2_02_FULL_42_12]
MVLKKRFVVLFKEVGRHDIGLVGGKGANLGEMFRSNFPVPDGFIVTSPAYFAFLKENNLAKTIKHLLGETRFDSSESLAKVSSCVQEEIKKAPMSDELVSEIYKAYRALGGVFADALVAVRSSATAEDLPTASFAGQQDTYLNVRGESNLLLKIKEAWASLFTPRAMFYRHEQHFDHFRVGIAIPVQKMVESEKSGVMFTIDPITNDKTKIVIEAIYGLGEFIVQGTVTPDHYEVSKKDLSILNKATSIQTILLKRSGRENKTVRLSKKAGAQQKITDKQVQEIARLGKKLEEHYYFPQDVEWAIEKNKIYIVQTRPVTTVNIHTKKEATLSGKKVVLLKGQPASPGIKAGSAKVIKSAKEIHKIMEGDVLVAPQTNPDFVPAMKKAVAIVTDSGGRTSHAAIVSRELGIPAVVGTTDATHLLKNGMLITVNGTAGEVYKGSIVTNKSSSFEESRTPLVYTKTKVYVNLAEPELADAVAKKHVDGVGLLRAEFMMAGIGIHPKKLIREGKKKIFIETMAHQITTFCKAFFPHPVVYRTSDLKTNEYRNLVGGRDYEPVESNPMLGYRGAFRYVNDPDVFELELEAIKIVRNKNGLKNLWVMLPFVRNVKELIGVKKLISQAGLYRSDTFKLWMMVEIPANVILLEKFIRVGIDGISIGSNDLTMLITGTDRDNSEVAREFNEQDEAVLWALEHAVKTAKQYKITSSLCGQAASQYPRLVEKLVGWGITSVSVSPDAIDHTRSFIAECEKQTK